MRKIASIVASNVASTALQAARLTRDIVKHYWEGGRLSYSQHGEDIDILSLFPRDFRGRYLDIGASHPIRISNTYLLYRHGWRGVAIEPLPTFRLQWKLFRPEDVFVNVAIGCESGTATFYELWPSVLSTMCEKIAHEQIRSGKARLIGTRAIRVVTPTQLIEEICDGAETDFLSMDIEGSDALALACFPFQKWRPKVVCVEVGDCTARLAIERQLETNDFMKLQERGCNQIWVDNRRRETLRRPVAST